MKVFHRLCLLAVSVTIVLSLFLARIFVNSIRASWTSEQETELRQFIANLEQQRQVNFQHFITVDQIIKQQQKLKKLTTAWTKRPQASRQRKQACECCLERHSRTNHINISTSISSNSTDRFLIQPYFHFPAQPVVKSKEELLQSKWVQELKSVLQTMNSKQLILTQADGEYKEVFLNWLISAVLKSNVPIEQILVISMNKSVHEILVKRGFRSVLVLVKDVLRSDVMKRAHKWQLVVTARFTVLRLVSHWGYDVLICDADAMLLKNPLPLFDQYPDSTLIGQHDRWPPLLYKEWGHTMCGGVVFMRSSFKLGT